MSREKQQEAGVVGTDPQMGFVFKYWAALVLFVGAFLIAGRDLFDYPARIPLVLALATWGLFSLTAAEVRMSKDSLMYRRFLRWNAVAYSDITECRLCLWAVYGSLRFKRSVKPWGKVYFITARPTPGPRALVDSINVRRQHIAD